MTFRNFIAETLGTTRWAICPNTARNRMRYDACITNSQYDAISRAYMKAGGDPAEVSPKIAREFGYDLRWVKAA